jgi:hypothetical protein
MTELIKALEAVDKLPVVEGLSSLISGGLSEKSVLSNLMIDLKQEVMEGRRYSESYSHHALIGYRAGKEAMQKELEALDKAYATETLRLHETYAEVAVLQDALGCFDVDYDLEPGEEVSIQLTYEDQVKLRKLSPIPVDPTSIAQPTPNNPELEHCTPIAPMPPQPDWDNITEADLERLAPLPAEDEPEWQEFTPSPDNPTREGDEQLCPWAPGSLSKKWVPVTTIGLTTWVVRGTRYRRRVTNQEGK